MILIYVFSSLPGNMILKLDILDLDKFIHILEYFVLGGLLLRAFFHSNIKIGLVPAIISSIVIATAFSVINELHQRYVPDRTAEVLDVIGDLIGSAIGVFVYRKRRQSWHQ
jgi:VanZ family protein